jgi:glutamyl-tRNA synthetase
MQIRSRIAPTPSGFLHLGNVFSFVLTWLIVRKKQGYLLLKIDDLDSQRRRMEYVDDIFSTLEWLGLDYDEGASGTSDFLMNFSQESRIHEYENLLHQLIEKQGLVFECSCSRADIQYNTTNGLYAGTCRRNLLDTNTLGVGKSKTAWRVIVPNEPIRFQDMLKGEIAIPLAENMGDFVVRRKEGTPAYQIASLSDDLRYNINLVVRGSDLINSTAAQVFIAQQADRKEFTKSIFLHHGLLCDNTHQKMSKSAGALSIKAMRAEMSSPRFIFQWFARQFGRSEKVSSLQELLEIF